MSVKIPDTTEKVPTATFALDINTLNTRHLPPLTEKQFAFVDLLARGYPVTTAYSKVYEENKAPNKWTGVAGFRLSHNEKIAKWVNAIRSHQVRSVALNLDDHLLELHNLREMAKEQGKLHVALQAERLRGKASGLYDVTSTVLMGDVNELYRQITEHTKDANPLAVTLEGQALPTTEQAEADSTGAANNNPLAVSFDPQELASLEQEAKGQGLKVKGLEYEDELDDLLGFEGDPAGG
jgi:hypothetical protein